MILIFTEQIWKGLCQKYLKFNIIFDLSGSQRTTRQSVNEAASSVEWLSFITVSQACEIALDICLMDI